MDQKALTLREVLEDPNALDLAQKLALTADERLDAIVFYWKHDAFIDLQAKVQD